jgi:alpha-ketoglutarate-dependent 2,4-dichlorophenoxyacetate dioxygenase
MTLTLQPLHPLFGAEASGVDLRKPLAPDSGRAIERAMDRYAVLVFRGQPLTQEEQLAFARSFGTLDLGLKKATRAAANLTGYDEIIDISNVDAQGKVYERSHRKTVSNLANQLWHSDSSFQKTPARYSILHAVVVPAQGGETEFADLRAAYDALAPDMKAAIENLHAPHFALHSRIWLGEKYSQAELDAIPPAEWPLVRVHPGSKRKLLWVGIHATSRCVACSSTSTRGARATASCGTTAPSFTAAGRSTLRSTASCGAPRPRTSRPLPRPRPWPRAARARRAPA